MKETDKAEDLGSSDGEDDDKNEEYGGTKFCDEKEDPSTSENPPHNKMSTEKKDGKKTPSFIDALKLLSFPEYHHVDAYPTLCQVYAIAVAIPISSAFAERTFSTFEKS